MFKNLFAPKPEFPLKDERPPQHLRAVAPLGMPVGAPRAPGLPRSFELVGTLTPFEMIEDEDRVALEAATPEAAAAAAAAAAAEAEEAEEAEEAAAEAAAAAAGTDDDVERGGAFQQALRDRRRAVEREEMLRQLMQDRIRPPPPPQQRQLANGVVFSLRIRRIRDGETLAAMETTIRAYTERKMKQLTAMDPMSQQVWGTRVKYASHSYKYSCLPEEKVLLWASTDKLSYDLLTKMIIFKDGWGGGWTMGRFWMDLFGQYNSTFPLTTSGNALPMPDEADEVWYKHTKSYQTKWNLSFKFVYPSTWEQTGLTESIPVFSASEFTLQSEQSGEPSARRMRSG